MQRQTLPTDRQADRVTDETEEKLETDIEERTKKIDRLTWWQASQSIERRRGRSKHLDRQIKKRIETRR